MSDSFIKLSPKTVLGLCQSTLDRAYQHRAARCRKIITEHMDRHNNNWFHKLFKIEDWTYERAKKYVESLDSWTAGWGYRIARWIFEAEIEVAYRLKAAAPSD